MFNCLKATIMVSLLYTINIKAFIRKMEPIFVAINFSGFSPKI
jgi:hypothetical protein